MYIKLWEYFNSIGLKIIIIICFLETHVGLKYTYAHTGPINMLLSRRDVVETDGAATE